MADPLSRFRCRGNCRATALPCCLSLIALCTLSLAISPNRASAADLKDLSRGVLLYMPMDGSTAPRYAAGATNVSGKDISFAEGKAGRAAVVKSAPIAIPGLANFNYPRGTVSFWICPHWSSAEQTDRTLFGIDNFVLNYQPARHCLFFMTGTALGTQGYRWDYSTADYERVAGWKSGSWHHVAITWDAASGKGDKVLYLDGKAVSSSSTPLIRHEPPLAAKMVDLGRAQAPGLYDEWIIWDRVLSPEEIALLATRPAEAAQSLDEQLPQLRQAAAWPVEFSIQGLKPEQTIVQPGATFVSQVPVHNSSSAAFNGPVQFILRDFWLKDRDSRTIDLHLAPGEKRTLEIPFVAPESGVFKVAVLLQQQDKTFSKDVSCFAAIPELSHPLSDDSFFGVHVNTWSEGMVQQAARLGFRWNRDHNMLQATWWVRVQPDPGEFTWTYDYQYDRMNKYHFDILGQFFGMPYWAAADGRKLAKPAGDHYPFPGPCDLDAFRNYVIQTVKHYPKVRCWEIWNEPDVSLFWNGTPEQFAELCKVAYQAAKQTDPGLTVMNGGYTRSSWAWATAAAKAGALKYADAISFHAYCAPTASPEELERYVKDQTDFWHGLAKQYTGHDLPIWDTESGASDTTWLEGFESPSLPPLDKRAPLNWRAATLVAVQGPAIMQANDMVRSFMYLCNVAHIGAYEGPNALEMNNAPKPKLFARAVMARELDGATVAGVVHRNQARLCATVYRQGDDRSIVLLWTGRGGAADISTGPAGWAGRLLKRVDIMGNDHAIDSSAATLAVDEEPIYVHVAGNADAVLAALKSVDVAVRTEPQPLPPAPVAGAGAPDVPKLPPYVAPSEDASAVFTVDLRPYANMGLADAKAGDGIGGWSDEGPFNDIRDLHVGRQTFHGVPFDIIDPASNDGKAVLTLRGSILTPDKPATVSVTLPQGRVRCLYFLHAAAWGEPGRIGKYVVHFQDGQSLDLPLVIPGNTGNWWTGYNTAEESRPVPVRVTNTKDGKPAWRYLRVWEWQNPRRDVPVTSVDVVSAGGRSTPIVLAITGVR